MHQPLNFAHKNLRGHSFKGQNLQGANFAHADIRGANFSGANLRQANFTQATTGLQRRYTGFLILVSLLLSLLSGIFSAFSGVLIASFFSSANIDHFTILPGITLLLVLGAFFLITIRRGLVVSTVITGIVAIGGAIGGAFLGILAGAVGGVLAGSLVGTLTGALAIAGAGAGAGVRAIGGIFSGAGALVIAVLGSVAGVRVVLRVKSFVFAADTSMELLPLVIAGLASIAISGLGVYIAWRVLAGEEEYIFVRTVAVAFAATGGTSFRQANLTDADFTGAILKGSDLRGAILTRTCWYEAQKLELARLGPTILAKAKIRELLVTGNGYQKNFRGENLQGANLAGANLEQINFKEADLSHATLRGASLKEANLTKVQALDTDFAHVYLTGACLEAWNINETTNLDQVDCQYVFLLEYSDAKGNRDRRPHDPDRLFAPRDFAQLYQKITNTVQILLRDGGSPAAFNIAFQKLMAENPEIDGNSIQAIEKKDNDVLLTIVVPEDTDKGKIERDFLTPYQRQLEAEKNTLLLEAELRHNQDMKELAILALTKDPVTSPVVNVTNNLKNDLKNDLRNENRNENANDNRNENANENANDLKSESKAMTDSIDNSRRIENKDGNVIGNILGDDGTISGTIAHTISQLPASPQGDQPGLKELLTQLHQVMTTDSALTPAQTAKAAKQVQALAEAGKDPKSSAMKEMADDAMTMLKGIVIGLPSAAAAVKACNELLPAISSIFGL